MGVRISRGILRTLHARLDNDVGRSGRDGNGGEYHLLVERERESMSPKTCAALIMTAVTLGPIVGPVAWSVLVNDYPVRDRDWNLDGETTVTEFFAAVDVGVRPIACGEEFCVEYFWFKDGLRVSIVCPGLGPAISCP